MQRDYCVYMHTSPVGKVYVGITHTKPQYRWNNGKGYNGNHFKNAIQKYGWENFGHMILAKNLTSFEAYNLEIQLIKYYKSNNPKYGYNSSIGGDKSALGCRYTRGPFSQEHKKSLSKAWENRRLNGKGIAWNKGLTMEQMKDKLDLTNFIKAGKLNAEKIKRPILQIDLYTDEIIQEFDCVKNAAKYFNKSYISSIIDCAKGNRKSAFGYRWEYK